MNMIREYADIIADNIIADTIEKELERMNNTLNIHGHCSTIEHARIHRLLE